MFDIKKIAAAAVSLTMALCLAGCSDSKITDKAADASSKGKKLSVVCTIFPEYDWTREILGSNAENTDITYLLDSGVDLHNYQPTAEDILKISNCDMFIYVGGESDEWVEGVLAEADNKDMKVIELLDLIGSNAKEEEVKEGMQAEEEEEEEGEEGGPEYDEHVWLSLRNAELICAEIEKSLAELDPDNAESYKTNLDGYTAKLENLDNDFKALAESSGDKALIFGDRFPFRYFTDDYGFDYYAAFVGCSAETEASFETIAFLAQKADELNADTIYTIENSDGRIAQAVIDATANKDQKIAVLDSIQSVSGSEIENGTTYLSIMQSNYETLRSDISENITPQP